MSIPKTPNPEEFISGAIRGAIEHETKRLAEPIIEQAKKDLEKAAQQALTNICLRVVGEMSMEQNGNIVSIRMRVDK